MRILLSILFLIPSGPGDPPPVEISINDNAWPGLSREIGRRFGMNARGTIPVKIAGEGGLKSDAIRSLVPTRSHHRIISITVHNTGTENLTRAVVWLPQVDERREVNIPVGGWKRVFFTLPERANRKKLSVQLRRAGEIIVEMEKTLGPAKTGPKQEADLLRHELQEEQKVRDKWVRRALTIRTVSNASLTMIHRELGLLRTAKTGSNGVWKGRLLGGDWEVLVRSVRYPRKMPTGKGEGTTAVLEQPYVDLTYLAGKVNLKSSSREVEILPDRHGEVSGPVLPETLSLSPSPFTKSLRYETVHRSAGNDLILRADFTKGGPVSRIRFHTTSNLAFDLLGWSRSGLTGLTRFVPEGEVSLEMEKRKSGRVIFDPAALPGCVGLDLSFSCPSRPRERYSLSISERTGITVPAGNLRVQFQARMEGGGILHFSPSVHRIAGGRGVDLSPTPLRLFPHFQPTRGLLLWLAVVDDRGRFVTRFRGISGTLEGFLAGKPIFSREIGELTFHFPNQFEGLAVDAIQYRVKLNIGGEVLPYKGPAFPRRQFDDPPAHVVVPEMLEEKARAVMPMVRKTLGGSLRTFGLPKFDLTLKFEIRLPPDVGGLGGGGKILLDIGQILNYAHETDSLPGAYTHELGHCLGFGHDPYMTMAPCGADEGLYDVHGYRMRYGRVPGKLLDWLDRTKSSGEWTPSGGVFAAMRMMYGPTVHGRMFQLRRNHEKVLAETGFSIPERMAAWYSEVTRKNLAWMFRAFGWPVFDFRVDVARKIMKNPSLAGGWKYPKKIDGSYLTKWWVRGPMVLDKKGNPKNPPPWKIQSWEKRFLRLSDEGNFLKRRGYHFFLTVGALESQYAYLAIGSDVQVRFYLNGRRVNYVSAAPQFRNPVHDGYTMERKNATVVPILLRKGANTLEMTVVKPPGSKGMFIEIAGSNGNRLRDVGYDLSMGPGERKKKEVEEFRHPRVSAVYNASFETGKKVPGAWIAGAKEGDGKFRWSLDGSGPAEGGKSLRLEADGPLSGSAIQRIVVEEGAVYELSGWIRTEGFRGGSRAWVMLFTGNPAEDKGLVRSDVIEKNQRRWKKFKVKWEARRREVYIGCVLRATSSSKAWFDGLTLKRVK